MASLLPPLRAPPPPMLCRNQTPSPTRSKPVRLFHQKTFRKPVLFTQQVVQGHAPAPLSLLQDLPLRLFLMNIDAMIKKQFLWRRSRLLKRRMILWPCQLFNGVHSTGSSGCANLEPRLVVLFLLSFWQ